MKPILAVALLAIACHTGLCQSNIASFTAIGATQALGDKVFFAAADNDHGTELFVTDRFGANVTLLKDIYPGYGSSTPGNLTVLNNQLFFTAYSFNLGTSIWKTDGTVQGTQLVYAVKDAEPAKLMVFKGKLYFTTNTGAIMRTDGTEAGTQTFYQSDYHYGRVTTIEKNDQYLYFSSDGRTFYRDDGTTRIEFLGPLSWEDVYFRKLFILDDKLVVLKSSTYSAVNRFYAIDTQQLGSGQEEDQWAVVKKVDAPNSGSQTLENFTYASGKLFFSVQGDPYTTSPLNGLWVCDGTAQGTKLLKAFTWEASLSFVETNRFFAFKGKLYFGSNLSANQALYTSDGTEAGTVKVHDAIIASRYDDDQLHVLVADDKFYFTGGDTYNPELWQSDGTAAGTAQLFDLADAGGSSPHDFTYANGMLYFVTSVQFAATLWSAVPAPDISLTSQGTPLASGATTALFYGVAPGACKSTDLVIKNKGLSDLYLRSVSITGNDMYLDKQSIPSRLAPGESVTLQVTYNPTTEAKTNAGLTVLSNDRDESHYVVNLQPKPASSAPDKICKFLDGEYVKSLEPQESASSILLSNAVIAESQPTGTPVGEFSFPSSPSGATYTLAPGEGDADNNDFLLDGNKLKSNTIFNYDEKTLYTLRVKVTSSGGEAEASFRIRVGNVSAGVGVEECKPVFESMSFSYSALEANASGHLFATTTDGKVMRSVDGGNTWDVIYADRYVSLAKIVFKGNTGYIQGAGALLKSDDGGATWYRLAPPLTGEYFFGTVAMYFFDDKQGYLATENGQILYTADGGRSWETRVDYDSYNQFRTLTFVTKDKGYATVDFGDLWKTTDGGRTWNAVDLSALGWGTRVGDIQFTSDTKGFLATESNFYTTTNGGQSWTKVTSVYGMYGASIKFVDDKLGFLFGAGYGPFFRTVDGGDTWEMIETGMSPGGVVGVAQALGKLFVATKSAYYSYNATRGIGVSADNGATWSVLNNFTERQLYDIQFRSDKKGVVLGEDGYFKTDDNGLTWKQQTINGLTNSYDLHFIDDNTMLIINDGHVYKSTDGGATVRRVLETQRTSPYTAVDELYAAPGNILFAYSWYVLFRSVDLGETWEMIAYEGGYTRQDMYFVTASTGYQVELFGSVIKTTDGGKTWNDVFIRDPNEGDVTNTLFFLDENLGYKGGDELQRTTNGGASWQAINWPFYEIIAVHFENKDHGYVVERGGRVSETNDAAETWREIYSTGAKVARVQFRGNEIYLVGENGFAARMNTTPRVPATPGYINGPDQVCAGDAVAFYLAPSYGSRTQWSTTAADMDDRSNMATISFPDAGEYTITAKYFNACGSSNAQTKTVTVSGHPEGLIIQGTNLVTIGQHDVPYTVVNANKDSHYLWSAEGGTALATNTGATVDWRPNASTGSISVLEVDPAGCRAYGSLDINFTVVGVEQDLQNQVTLYPNPSAADTRIASVYNGTLSVRIIDAQGHEHSRTTLSPGNDQVIPTKSLAPGLYLVQITDGQQSITKKLIKK